MSKKIVKVTKHFGYALVGCLLIGLLALLVTTTKLEECPNTGGWLMIIAGTFLFGGLGFFGFSSEGAWLESEGC